jgi:hypothetical protein
MSFVLLIVCGSWAGSVLAAGPSTVEDSENSAKHALDAAKVTAFDGALTYVSQEVVAKPAADAVKQISYTIAGPGEGVKSSVEFRIYLTAGAAAAHSNPPWSRCYYYAGGDSNVVVVGTTSSPTANEAIMVTAMGAQTLSK